MDDKEMTTKDVWLDIKKWLSNEVDYWKLTATEKLVVIFSGIAIVAVSILLGGMALFYLSFSLAYLLEGWFESLALAFTIVAIVILLLLAVVLLFRRTLIYDPISRILTKLFLNPPHRK